MSKNVRKRTILNVYIIVAMAMAVPLTSFAESLQGLPQFDSENSATILGLDNKDAVSEKDIKMAAKRLLSRFHPDKFSSEKYSEADRIKANAITQKIISAQDSLTTYLKINPAFSPAKESGSPNNGASSKSGFQNSSPHSDQGSYTWQDFGDQMKKERAPTGSSVVNMDHYGSSMRGTMFEFLHQFPDANIAYLELSQGSTQAANHDAIMVIRPETFPNIEFRLISRDRDGNATQTVKSVYGTYVRGHHQGNSGRNLVDSIVFKDGTHFPPGTYLMPAFTGQIKYKGEMSTDVTAVKSVRMTGHPTAMFVFMNSNGYSNSTLGGYVSESSKPSTAFLKQKTPVPTKPPVAKVLGWRDVKASQAPNDTIQLKYEGCPAGFGSLTKK
ncbi:hypothetical protein BH10BDE1_BH10BDE1_02180 [soil metagenome]